MEFNKLCLTRESVRDYSSRPVEQGLGTCWICSFDTALCAQIFGLPENLEPAVIIPIGYANYVGERQKERRPLSEIVEIL
ncbi:MAG: nitroreductase family protein [Bacteroidales bacterium]|nr:nitroreductase family protein [Bacteroidales bacterium]